MARKTLPEPTAKAAEVTVPVPKIDWVEWATKQGTRAVWFEDRNGNARCRVKVDGDIEYEAGSYEEACALCEERLQRRRMRMARR